MKTVTNPWYNPHDPRSPTELRLSSCALVEGPREFWTYQGTIVVLEHDEPLTMCESVAGAKAWLASGTPLYAVGRKYRVAMVSAKGVDYRWVRGPLNLTYVKDQAQVFDSKAEASSALCAFFDAGRRAEFRALVVRPFSARVSR